MFFYLCRWRNLTPSPLTPAMRAVMEARSRRREEQEQQQEQELEKTSGNSAKLPSENNGNSGSGSSPTQGGAIRAKNSPIPTNNGSPSKKRPSPSSPSSSTPRRKLNFGNKGKRRLALPLKCSSKESNQADGCNRIQESNPSSWIIILFTCGSRSTCGSFLWKINLL